MNQTGMFFLFFVIVFGLFGLMQYRLYRLIRRWSTAVYEGRARLRVLKAARVFLLVVNALLVAQFVLRGSALYQNPLLQTLVIYPAGILFAVVVFSFLLVSFSDVLRLAVRAARSLVPLNRRNEETSGDRVNASRRRFLKLAGLTAGATTGSVPLMASMATARDYQINRLDLNCPALPPSLEGLTVAQVSDLHSGVFMTGNDMKEIFELVNMLRPQIIMITGDFVDTSDTQIDPLVRAVETLRADIGMFGCLGNHDHFATADRVAAAMEQRGIVMLNNASTTLRFERDLLSVIGIDDAGRGQMDFSRLDQAFASVSPEAFKILLTHRPHMWDAVKDRVDLTLAGHTHGGQVGIQIGPLNLNPVYLVHKYAMGHFVEEGRHLYVNVGVGMVGVPIRMVKPEITLFTLRSGT